MVERWEQHRDRMLRVARGYAGQATTAEDIVQEAFHRAVLRCHTLRNEAAVGKWLEGITRSVGHQIARKRSRRELLAERNIRELEPGVVSQRPSEPDPRIELALAAAESLPEAQRDVFRLSLKGAMTVAEIAEVLGRPGMSPTTCIARPMRMVALSGVASGLGTDSGWPGRDASGSGSAACGIATAKRHYSLARIAEIRAGLQRVTI